ncbi:MAG TPA: LysM peptidoglycan-binding domain-containing protein [Saprospiraceae bacterium]|nr:LysM peptidoglycan-binding domain-containing protein [Saprospiraceae bacterium]HMQ83849.1 LysM peptidoglycan-binding domain-containing protein [Saprospiraceae bacterium]
MKKMAFLSACLMCFLSFTQAANLYILYDSDCMDRLEYNYKSTEGSSSYIMYQVNVSPEQKIILEVGIESTNPQDFLPAQFIKCNNAIFDEKLVNAINSNIDQIFMVVKQSENRYLVSPIIFAARYLRSEDALLYDSPKYRFQFDLKRGAIGENIAFSNPKAVVFFEGKLENECSGAYIFHQYAEFSGNPHTDILLVPEIGIVEERSGINLEDALNNTLMLEKVNGRTLSKHMARVCSGVEDEAEKVIPQPNNSTVVSGNTTSSPTNYEMNQKTVVSPSKETLTNKGNEFHTVKEGETLYRISKNYGISVDQLRAWNSKGNSNLIRKGEKLRVAAPSGTTLSGQSPTPKEFNIIASAPTLTSKSINASNSQGVSHTVQSGETIASIALKYGYTEAKLREINQLGKNDYARIGQVLKVSDCPDVIYTSKEPTSLNASIPVETPKNYEVVNPGNGNKTTVVTSNLYDADLGITYELPYNPNELNTPNFYDLPPQPGQDDEFYVVGGGNVASNSANNTPVNSNPVNYDAYYKAYNEFNSNSNSGNNTLYNKSVTVETPKAFDYVTPPPPSYGSNVVLRTTTPQQTTSYDNSAATLKKDRSIYMVKEGDTLYSIARKYGLSVERLRELNNLSLNEVIIPYQKLYLN